MLCFTLNPDENLEHLFEVQCLIHKNTNLKNNALESGRTHMLKGGAED